LPYCISLLAFSRIVLSKQKIGIMDKLRAGLPAFSGLAFDHPVSYRKRNRARKDSPRRGNDRHDVGGFLGCSDVTSSAGTGSIGCEERGVSAAQRQLGGGGSDSDGQHIG
jgi:hypothetical protein